MYERHGYDLIYSVFILFQVVALFLFYIGKLIRLVNIKHFYLQARLLVTYIRY